MNDARSLRRPDPALDGPRPGFFRTDCKKCLEVEESVRGANKDVEPGFGQTHLVQELLSFFFRKLHDLRLELSRQHDDLAFFLCGEPSDALHVIGLIPQFSL